MSREERDLIRKNKWWLLCVPAYISAPSESGRVAAKKMSSVEFATSLPEIKGELDTASIFYSNIDLVLLSQISY